MTSTSIDTHLRAAAADAGAAVGLPTVALELIRLGENALYRRADDIIVRVSRAGQESAAAKEIRVAQWLEQQAVPAVRAWPGIEQPVQARGRPVTFWRELPRHHPAGPAQIGAALRGLHGLLIPAQLNLPPLDPFVRIAQRIDAASTLTESDRRWLHARLSDLQDRYQALPQGGLCVVHGDPWAGNVLSTEDGQVVLVDLERVGIGLPQWDLVSTAIKHSSFGFLTAEQYEEFCVAYGADVTGWHGFDVLRDIRELRMTTMAAQLAATDSSVADQAALRVACVRGEKGPRPWRGWRAVP